MENPEEILHSLEEFSKIKPKDIPRELEEYLKFVAKTGDPVYQWTSIKSLFREKLINVITEFYESCTSMEIPPCPNVEMFNYDLMKNFILEKLETFASAPFTLQRICELLTSPRKEYTRIDKYMRALEKNILVVSTTEPGGRRTENGEGIMNGIESDHEQVPELGNEINVEEMDESSSYVQTTNHLTERLSFDDSKNGVHIEINNTVDTFASEKLDSEASTSSQEIVCVQYLSIEPVTDNTIPSSIHPEGGEDKEAVSVTITAINIKSDADHPIVEENIDQSEQETGPTSAESSDANVTESKATVIHPIETSSEVDMEMEPVQSTSEILQKTIAETPSSTTVPDKFLEDVDSPATKTETESISPENSITSSNNSSCESSNDSNISTESPTTNFRTEIVEEASAPEDGENSEFKNIDSVVKDICDGVDSTTKSSGDANLSSDSLKEQEEVLNKDSELESVGNREVEDNQCVPEVESANNDKLAPKEADICASLSSSTEAEIVEEPSESTEPSEQKPDDSEPTARTVPSEEETVMDVESVANPISGENAEKEVLTAYLGESSSSEASN